MHVHPHHAPTQQAETNCVISAYTSFLRTPSHASSFLIVAVALVLRFWLINQTAPTKILEANPEIKTFKAVFGDLVVERGPPRPPGG